MAPTGGLLKGTRHLVYIHAGLSDQIPSVTVHPADLKFPRWAALLTDDLPPFLPPASGDRLEGRMVPRAVPLRDDVAVDITRCWDGDSATKIYRNGLRRIAEGPAPSSLDATQTRLPEVQNGDSDQRLERMCWLHT